jgi:NAD(P)-dependent dehydrogenase (short-subunit alcohol dehydrogenase family)
MTEALAVEGKPYEIRVNAVAPGAVDTEMLKKAAPHLKTNTKPIDIAHVIVSLCDEESSGAVSGSTVEVFSNG